MSKGTAPFLVAVSGPDGVGKSTLVHHLVPALRARGLPVATAHWRGCVLCRMRRAAARRRTEPRPTARRSPSVVHGLLDAAVFALWLAVARWRAARRSGGGGPGVVVWDRGPVDGLVTFNPAPHGPLGRRFLRLAGGYDLTLLLEAQAGAVAGLGQDSRPRPAREVQQRYRRWAGRLRAPVVLRNGAGPEAVARQALRLLLDRLPPAGPTSARRAGRPRIVLSVIGDARGTHRRGDGAAVVETAARRLADAFDVTVLTAGRRHGARTGGRVTHRRLPVRWAGSRAGRRLFQALLPLVARRTPHDLWLESFTQPISAGFHPLSAKAPVSDAAQVVGIEQVRCRDAEGHPYAASCLLADGPALRGGEPVALPTAPDEGVRDGVTVRPARQRSAGGDFVLFLGRVDIWHNGLDLLLAAHARAGLGMPLVLAGSGTRAEERRLDALLARKGQGAGVIRVGRAAGEHKERLLADCAFVVMPARHEAFGLAALEAMAHGKPVVHFDLDALRWTGAGGTVPVPPYDVDALARIMERLATDPLWRRQLGDRARATSHTHSWDAMTERYVSLAHRLLDDGPSPVPDGAR